MLTVDYSSLRSICLLLAIVVALFTYILVAYAVLLVTTDVSSLRLAVERWSVFGISLATVNKAVFAVLFAIHATCRPKLHLVSTNTAEIKPPVRGARQC